MFPCADPHVHSGQHPEAAGVQKRRARGSGFREEATPTGETVPGGPPTMRWTRFPPKIYNFVLMISTKRQSENDKRRECTQKGNTGVA